MPVLLNLHDKEDATDPVPADDAVSQRLREAGELLLHLLREILRRNDDAVLLDERGELRPREGGEQLRPRRRGAIVLGLADVAYPLPVVGVEELGPRWLRDDNGALPPTKAMQMHVLLSAGAVAWGDQFARLRALEAESAELLLGLRDGSRMRLLRVPRLLRRRRMRLRGLRGCGLLLVVGLPLCPRLRGARPPRRAWHGLTASRAWLRRPTRRPPREAPVQRERAAEARGEANSPT
mmetsp:Transcript_53060/g.152968  ORF Transcript_53060/g.152968 Transcript_53060/m.152968 type:complete len:237 (+) Transcript_53060:1261-1971(+)